MQKGKGLRKLFNRIAASTVLTATLVTGAAMPVLAQTPTQLVQQTVPAPISAPIFPAALSPATADYCPAFPDFKRPDAPTHRMPRDLTPDPVLRGQQEQLRTLGVDAGPADGLMGNGARAGLHEYLLFWAPLYGGTSDHTTLTAQDAAQLKIYADKAAADAAAKPGVKTLPAETAAALRLAAGRTGVDYSKLATAARTGGHLAGVRDTGAKPGDLFKFDNPTWLYLVKTYGASYGLDVYAKHVTLETQDGKVTPSVDNPFLHRQLLDLKGNPRLSALLAGEYLAHKDAMPLIAKPAVPVFDAAVKAQQTELAAIGFDVGAADGRKGELAGISIGEYQLLYGKGVATGTLSDDEAASLKAAALEAAADARKYGVPTVAAGAIRLASDKNSFDFPYLMELASAESSFSHTVKASSTSATGLYQFIESTWSEMLRRDGAKYGLGDFADQVTTYKDSLGRDQAYINNPLLRAEAMELRKNPHLASLLSADFQRDNQFMEGCYVPGPLTRTDLYLAHFLGASDAVYFLDQMAANPSRSAPQTFPEEASYNVNVFYETSHGKILRDRTLKEVYDSLGRKFNIGLYDGGIAFDPGPSPAAPPPAPPIARKNAPPGNTA